jgi:hypothetical protein
VLVPSLKRSGTHLLIDAILNNFARYKRRPLYVDIDHLLSDPRAVDRVLACGGYVVKTHFPQVGPAVDRSNQLQRLISEAVVISPVRDPEAVFRSSMTFGSVADRAQFDAEAAAFADFWGRQKVHYVPFARLVDRDRYAEFIAGLGRWLGLTPNPRLILPFRKHARTRLYVVKVLTRLLGHASPIVNTTIGFAKTETRSDPS